MNRTLLLSILALSTVLRGWAQNIHGFVEAQGILTTKGNVPFWMRSDQYGSVPLAGASGAAIGAIRRDYDTTGEYWLDWGAGVEVRENVGMTSRASLIAGYGKIKAGMFELKAGRYKSFMGLVDSTLSSGAFAVSGNALGIPQVQLAIPQYWTLPFADGLFSVEGSFSYGWLGKVPVMDTFGVNAAKTYFHQSSLYVRMGRDDWAVKFYGGINHQVFWGDENALLGHKSYGLSNMKAFEYAVVGKTYQGSKLGNHLGSVDLGMEYDFDNVNVMLYRQFFYDEGALAHLANLADGLNGISLVNTNTGDGGFQWNKIVLELFYSKDQAGYPTSKRTPSGDENYYNNYQYAEGWSYQGVGLGNPFITPYTTTRKGLPNDKSDYFNNNRVVALYTGLDGAVGDVRFTTRLSYSFNYGTFGTSKWGYSTGSHFHPPQFGIWKEVNQFSARLEVTKTLYDGWDLGCVAALDNGGLFNNSGGLILRLRKTL